MNMLEGDRRRGRICDRDDQHVLSDVKTKYARIEQWTVAPETKFENAQLQAFAQYVLSESVSMSVSV